jgi:TRAP-type C4-dicarboxylate transport system substrate-binding protein
MTSTKNVRHIILILLALTVAAPTQAATIRMATLAPDGSLWDEIMSEMGAGWEQSTGGHVKLRLYPGGVAGDEADVIRKMRIGQLQAAALTTAGLAALDPAFTAFNIPMFFESYDELLSVIEKIEPVLKQRLEDRGFVLIAWGHGGWVHMFTKNRVTTIDELKKAKMFVWAGDDRMVQQWRSEGFTPVALAATDILTGLQTGMIEAFPTTPLLALTLQWYRMTPNMVGIGVAPLVGAMVVTKKAWDKLSEADRTAVMRSAATAENRLIAEVPRQDEIAIVEMQKRGLKVIEMSDEQRAILQATADRFAENMRGTVVPRDILEMVERERAAFRSRKPAKD